MADPISSAPDIANLDGLQGRPTFIQIRPPDAAGAAARRVGAAIIGVVLVAALGWTAYRLTDEPLVTEALPEARTPVPSQPPPRDLSPELAIVVIDAAMSSPAWSRPSLIDRLSPFDPSANARDAQAGAQRAVASPDTPPSTASYEVSVRLGKGETIGGALQKRGFAADSVAEAVAALAPHVSLKRLPIGLVLTLRAQPGEEEAGRPILQALTLQPDARREITVARDDGGNYVVERR